MRKMKDERENSHCNHHFSFIISPHRRTSSCGRAFCRSLTPASVTWVSSR